MWPTSMPRHQFQRALAVGRRVAGDDVADVGDDGRFRQVAAEIDAGEVETLFVGAADDVAMWATLRSARPSPAY
jgi:hypothetical protein